MKKLSIVILVIVLAAVIFVLYAKISKAPTTGSEKISDKVEQNDLITVSYPKPEDIITSPVTVKGEARGSWYFEATFPIMVVDWDGRIIGEGHAQAKGDWMTSEFVPFEATIAFSKPNDIKPGTYSEKGAIIFKKDNPSGDPRRDAALEVPVVFR